MYLYVLEWYFEGKVSKSIKRWGASAAATDALFRVWAVFLKRELWLNDTQNVELPVYILWTNSCKETQKTS